MKTAPFSWTALGKPVAYGGLFLLLWLLPFAIAGVEIAFGLMLAGWLIALSRADFRSESVWRLPQARLLLYGLAVFFLASAVSVGFSTHPAMSMEGLIEKWLEYLLFFVIAADLCRDGRILRWCAVILAVSASSVALEGITQEIFGRGLLRGRRLYVYERMTGPYTNPTDLGIYLMVVIPIILALMVQLRQRVACWLLAILLVVLLACFGRTESTGAWAALLAGLVIASAATTHRRFARYSLALLLVAGLSVAAALRWSGHYDAISFSDLGSIDRTHMWRSAAHMVADRPFFGHGLNTFMANYLRYWVGGESQPRYAHNCYLQMAAETGLVGLAAFAWLLGMVAWRLFRVLRASATDPLFTGWCAAVWAFILHASVDTNFYGVRPAALFWVVSGLAVGYAVRISARTDAL